MYTHARDWDAALRVAEANDQEAVPDVLAAQVGTGLRGLGDSCRLSTLWQSRHGCTAALRRQIEGRIRGPVPPGRAQWALSQTRLRPPPRAHPPGRRARRGGPARRRRVGLPEGAPPRGGACDVPRRRPVAGGAAGGRGLPASTRGGAAPRHGRRHGVAGARCVPKGGRGRRQARQARGQRDGHAHALTKLLSPIPPTIDLPLSSYPARFGLPLAMHAGAAGDAVAAAAARAQAYERGNDFARAIEAYLSPSGEGALPGELDTLQRCWEAGLALAARHQVGRVRQLPQGPAPFRMPCCGS
jgi:hypothetical protein